MWTFPDSPDNLTILNSLDCGDCIHGGMKDELADVAWDVPLTEDEGDPNATYDIFCKKILELQEQQGQLINNSWYLMVLLPN